jgi:feruloyl esterase
MKLRNRLPAPLALLLLGATAYSHAATPIACNALLNQSIEGATVTSAVLNVATSSLPEHCEVLGSIGQHTGADGQSYAVKFHRRPSPARHVR